MTDKQVAFEKWARAMGIGCVRNAKDPTQYAFAPARAAWACWQYLTRGDP